MGQIPWAANDPIFWVHHCNIDRIWASWNNAGHANPATSAWLNKTFVFAGPDGKGVKWVVKDYTNTKKCDYRYDRLIGTKLIAAVAESLAPAAVAAPVAVAKSSSGPVALGSTPVRVNLKAVASPSPAAAPAASPLAARLSALPDDHRLYLVINDFKATAQPETLYRVYLDLPDNAPSDPLNSNYVGSFNFFAAVPHGDDHEHADTARSISFDITDIAADLDAKGQLKAEHTVTIVPAKTPFADAKPVIGNISFVEQ
jgi:tyrosinase